MNTPKSAKQIFLEALEIRVANRTACLNDVCGEDASLRSDVESLLAAHDNAADFMEESPLNPTVMASLANPAIGQMVGPYRLTALIAAGGMGNVFLAERDDEDVSKQVAIKLTRRGFESDDLLRRFQN